MSRLPLTKLPSKTYPGFGLSMLDRAVKEYFAARCSTAELDDLRAEWTKDGKILCTYCAREDASRWDHYVPVSRGGDTVPGNLVPACASCDDSKQDSTLDEWAESEAPKRPDSERVETIREIVSSYQSRHGYVVRSFVDKLEEADVQTYQDFRKHLDAMRSFLVDRGIITRR